MSLSSQTRVERVVLIVLDSCGCGSSPDAGRYGDDGANTLFHVCERVGGLALSNLAELGLGRVVHLLGTHAVEKTRGAYGRMRETSVGKDTTTGHW